MYEVPTRFAPAERASAQDLERQVEAMKEQVLLREVLAGVPDLVLVLNPEREVVFANHALSDFTGLSPEEAYGLRPGELIGCVESENDSGGCGTGEACRTCGSVEAILAAMQGEEAQREAGLSLASGENIDLRITTRPIVVDGEDLTVMTLQDIGDEKRRKVLERVFFHDVLNTAGGVQGLAALLRGAESDQLRTITDMLEMSAGQLIDEIHAHRLLTAVEGDDYEIRNESVSIPRIVAEAVGMFTPLARSGGVTVQVDGELPNVSIETDHTMLIRVLGNLVKNAIEASESGMPVLIGAQAREEDVEFRVHNETHMPADVRLQVFKRSFSTKGDGRGLGTYSVKLFTDRYLGGDVRFESDEGDGTTFRVRLPLRTA